ncbi:DUF4270 domain-containing protein [Mucilaginibacter sp.]|uniref:DUF4270 domain-containing protein n=1 Tax=Mucilaginibacter sp. TaxID=1882438 RepID=UPI00263415CD|nr:DUF4270 domain-containing protein [Mucilaginibacter sp.]MDB5031587.1 hypothetical protein [Mucilaginibacter sp.]
MKFFRLDLLTLLISLFILNSCKNQDTIGLGVNSATQLSNNLIDTSTIIVNTIPDDSVATSALPVTPLSYFKDPLFGTTEANLAIDLNLPGSTAYVIPPGTISIDSAILVLRYAPGFYGDSIASRYKVNVYQLAERLFASSKYINTKKWKYDSSNLLGTKSFFSRTGDSIKIVQAVAGGPDTLVKIPPQLRIPINPNFINNILYNASATQLSSNLVFQNNVKGLYITLDKNQSGPGGTFMFALDSAAAIQIYYKNFDGTAIDTASVSLPSVLHAAEIKHTYSTTVQAELSNTTTPGKGIYIQGLGGLRTRISFPYLKNIVKSLGSNIVINRAELVITAAPGSTIPFAPVRKLTIYRYDLANQRALVEDATSPGDPRAFGAATFGGFYNAPSQQYHFLLTAYIQDLLSGGADHGTFIGVVPNDTNNTMAVTAQVDGRTSAVGPDNAAGADTRTPLRIKLNLIYTKIAK